MLGAQDVHDLLAVILYSFLGLVLYWGFFLLVVKLAPFSVIREIEEDQNIALAILIGAVMIGLSIIVAAAIT